MQIVLLDMDDQKWGAWKSNVVPRQGDAICIGTGEKMRLWSVKNVTHVITDKTHLLTIVKGVVVLPNLQDIEDIIDEARHKNDLSLGVSEV